ncbi:MAG: TetR family transcriptional regulator [Eubacteriales bacterium]|nr:TetR family transcriptional regulator [Eubacteriales bacterium]
MARASREQVSHRRDEIIDACDELYKTHEFKEITLKSIAERTSFSRPSIYNYFQTIEEIFLGLLQREYGEWIKDIVSLYENNERMTAEEFACALAHTLEKRETLLKIQSMNLYGIEENSRLEKLIEFKRVFFSSMDKIGACLEKFFPDMSGGEIEGFIMTFFPFLYGIYPYASPTEKMFEAMEAAGIEYKTNSIYNLVYQGIIRML